MLTVQPPNLNTREKRGVGEGRRGRAREETSGECAENSLVTDSSNTVIAAPQWPVGLGPIVQTLVVSMKYQSPAVFYIFGWCEQERSIEIEGEG